MSDIKTQMQSLQGVQTRISNIDYDSVFEKKEDNNFGMETVDDVIAGMDKSEAITKAAGMGFWDTYRGVKQLIGIDEEQMEGEQNVLNRLMEHPEWGTEVKAAYFGGLIADPTGWLIPGAKIIQAGRAGIKAAQMAWHGAKWGGISGYLGYVDEESSDRLTNAAMGVGAGIVLGGGASFIGSGGRKAIDFVKSKTAKELTDDPKAAVQEFAGHETPSLTNNIKRFYTGTFQPAKKKYNELTEKFLYKPIVLDNPIASLAGAGSAAIAMGGGIEPVNTFINRLEDERDLDGAPWRYALIGMIGGGAAVSGFATMKKVGKVKLYKNTDDEQTIQSYLGRRLIDNYNLPTEYKELKEQAFRDLNSMEYQFLDIAERAKALKEEEKLILYEFLDGQIRLDPKGKKVKLSDDMTKAEEKAFEDMKLIAPSQLKELSVEGRKIGKEARDLLRQTGQSMVDVGLLNPETFAENMNRYIRRTYKEKLDKKFLDIAKEGITNTDGKLGLKGVELLARGHRITLNPKTDQDKIKELLNEGYEKLGKPMRKKDGTTSIVLRLQLSKKRRKELGEIEDAAFAIKASGDLMSNDYATYKFYRDLSESEFALDEKAFKLLNADTQKAYRQLSATDKFKGSGLKTYGELAGKYVPKDMYDDIKIQNKFRDPESFYNKKWVKRYRAANSLWKRTKTSWNPTVHMNNIVSNIALADLHNMEYRMVFKHGLKVFSQSGIKNLNKSEFGAVYDDLVRLGVFDSSLAKQELGLGQKNWTKNYAKEFLKLDIKTSELDPVKNMDNILEAASSISERAYRSALGAKQVDNFLTDIYQREDQMFRVGLFMDRLNKAKPELDKFVKGSKEYNDFLESVKIKASKEARKAFIDYNIQAPVARILRETAIPFISYTYRIVPILAEAATRQPHKFAKWAAIGYALDYAGREQVSREEAEYERALMDQKQTARIFGLPFMPYSYIKMPDIARSIEKTATRRFDASIDWGLDRDEFGKKLPKVSNYLDITRWIPGGDVLGQTGPEGTGGLIPGLPAPFQPSFGLIGEFSFILAGIDPFTLESVDDPFKEGISETASRLVKVAQRLVPNNPLLFPVSGVQKALGFDSRWDAFDSWSNKKIMNALEQRDDSSPYRADLSVMMAMGQTVGIKLWPFDPKKTRRVLSVKQRRERSKIQKEMDSLGKELSKYRGMPLYNQKKKETSERVKELQRKYENLFIKERVTKRAQYTKNPPMGAGVVAEEIGKSTEEFVKGMFD
jgi:hypothetical protein